MYLSDLAGHLLALEKVGGENLLSHAAHQALNLKYFERNNLFSMHTSFVKHKSETAVCDIACTVV